MRFLIAGFFLLPFLSLAHDAKYIGKYSWGPEVDSFTPCESEKIYWVSHGWGSTHADLKGFYSKNAKEAYQSIYLEIRGHFHEELEDGFDAAYDGTIHISEVYEMSISIPNEC